MLPYSASEALGHTGSLATAAQWAEGTLLGSLGTAIAVISVATVGVTMLSGRSSIRSGVQVIIGCFLLFGAPIIAKSFMELVWTSRMAIVPAVAPQPAPQAAPPLPPVASDPYAGAAVPM